MSEACFFSTRGGPLSGAGDHNFTSACPLLQRKVYLVEAVLMGFLLGTVEKGGPEQGQSVVHQILDLLWLFMEVRSLTPGSGCQTPSWVREVG